MFDLLKKTMLTGIGMAVKTREEVEDLAKEWAKRQQMSEDEGRKFMDDLMRKYDSSVEKLEDRVEDAVKKVLKKTPLATQDELKSLKKEVAELKEAVQRQKSITDDPAS